jgi:hypothetical protein
MVLIPVSMVDVLFEESALVLTGIFITFISSFLYTINAYGFVHRGKYRKKEEAILIFLGATVFLGLMTPVIHEGSKLIIGNVPALSIVGVILLGTNFVLHFNIPNWKHTTLKTLLIYLLGVFLVVLGVLVSYYFS